MISRLSLRSTAILATSIASFLTSPVCATAEESALTRKLRESLITSPDAPGSALAGPKVAHPAYSWKVGIVTTTFWVGEDAAKNNPVPNHASSWDGQWAKNYGGMDTPDRAKRKDFMPADFTPGQNPFYIALPYNDTTKGKHKPEAATIIPWFRKAFAKEGRSVLKGKWVAIRYMNRVCFAQWEDCGPFRTDHWQYVFGTEKPKPNLNKGAGLDVSPAVRDFLGMNDTDVTDWKFVEFEEIPTGPWATHGLNNTFVQNKAAAAQKTASAAGINQ